MFDTTDSDKKMSVGSAGKILVSARIQINKYNPNQPGRLGLHARR